MHFLERMTVNPRSYANKTIQSDFVIYGKESFYWTLSKKPSWSVEGVIPAIKIVLLVYKKFK